MKKLRFGQEAEVDGIGIPQELLFLLAQAAAGEPTSAGRPPSFECKTCKRRFPSFQALGGHRASHKRMRGGGGEASAKPRVHGCTVCGLELAAGQALVGHMRRHRAAGAEEKPEAARGLRGFDLNLTPAENDGVYVDMGRGLVDCLLASLE